MTKAKYSDAELKAAICAVRLMQSAGILPDSNTDTFLGYVTDYLTDEWTHTDTNKTWNKLYERLERLYPSLKDVP